MSFCSVANNLNDIAKGNPDAVAETLERWRTVNTPEMDWLIAHALRTMLKQGHSGALWLLGYDPDVQIVVSELALNSDEISVGEALTFSLRVTSEEKSLSP